MLQVADAQAPEQDYEPLTVEERIEFYSVQYELDPNLMKSIAWAESRYKNVPNFKYDGESGTYSAYGIFQITRTTYMTYCGDDKSERFDIDKNIECAMIVASESGLHHWSESELVWKN